MIQAATRSTTAGSRTLVEMDKRIELPLGEMFHIVQDIAQKPLLLLKLDNIIRKVLLFHPVFVFFLIFAPY